MSNISLPRPRRPHTGSPLLFALRRQVDVLWALMLHDIKSRFFGNGLGYILTVLWPAAHLALLIVLFIVTHRPVPYGSSALLYASTGIMPYITWSYMSRFTMMAVLTNKNFLQYPAIKPLDIMFARLALEAISVYIICIGLICFNLLCQVDVRPVNLDAIMLGMFSAVLLGVGFGILNAVIVMIFYFWFIGYVGIIVLFWSTCGVAINPEALPNQIGYYLSWNPLMHSVELIRLGYYPDFPAHLLDRTYVLSVGAGSLALGLLLERACRRFYR